MAKSKVLIVGGTGYLGKRLVKASLAQGHETYVLHRPEIGFDIEKVQMLLSFKEQGARLVSGSFSDHRSLVDAVKLVDVVISAMSGVPLRSHQILLQLKLVDAIKEAGNVKRFLPSEFGTDPGRMGHALNPARVIFEDKMVVRKAIEDAHIPFTYVSANCTAGYFLGGLCQPLNLLPSMDSVVLLGDGNRKAIFVDEDDIAMYTIKTIDDPRTLNKTVYIRPPKNILSQREVVEIWEKLLGKELQKSSKSEEEFLSAMQEEGEFVVSVSKREVVAAVPPFQEHWLPLSNLDLLLPTVDVGVFFCYKNPTSGHGLTFGAMVGVLKKALAQALVYYYAFAGEVVQNSVGEPELLCNNRGVDFVEAFAEVDLKELNLYNPDETIEGKLVPKKKRGVLCVQATELRCGGLVVACTVDHRIADAYSVNMFLVSWAEIAQSKPISTLPSFCRSLLNPRCPGSIDPSLGDMYVPITALPPPKDLESDSDNLISRMYFVTANQLSRLQSLASTNGCRRTRLESFSAFLWKMIAKWAKINNVSRKIAKMGIVVDGRTRLSDGDEGKDLIMGSYFGNVLSIPYGAKQVDELNEMPLAWVADGVHEFLESAVTKKHFLGLIDWVEVHRSVPVLSKVYCSGTEDGPAFVVSSGQRFPVSKVDFGWGAPAFGSYHFPWGGDAGYVMPMPSPTGNGDWVVYLHLLKGQVEVIETEAAHIFKPLTCSHLQLD